MLKIWIFKLLRLTIPSVTENAEHRSSHTPAGETVKDYSHCGNQFCSYLKVKQNLPHDSSILLLMYLPKRNESKAHVDIKSFAQMFRVALFVIAEKWKQPKYPSTSEWLCKLGYIPAMQFCSATKRNELLIHAAVLWVSK